MTKKLFYKFIIADIQRTFSEMTLSEEGQQILESLSGGDLLVQSGGSYTVEFDESGTEGAITFVVDPEMSTVVEEGKLVQNSRFHDLQEDSVIMGGYHDDGEGHITEIDIEMKSASSMGMKIGKHIILKALIDSVSMSFLQPRMGLLKSRPRDGAGFCRVYCAG